MRRVIRLLRHMKESGGSTPSTYVTPKPRRKSYGTDFTNRRARKRKASRKKVDFNGNHLSAPVKRRGAGLPVALKFSSIRKVILESIVEVKEEVLEDHVVENQEKEVLRSGGRPEEMTENLGLDYDGAEESPQPPFGMNRSHSTEIHSQSGDDFHSESVSKLHHQRKSIYFVGILY